MMILAQPSAPLKYDTVYLINNPKNVTNVTNVTNITNVTNVTNINDGWCAQEIFTSFFNTLTNCKNIHILKQQFESLFVGIFLSSNPELNKMNTLFYKLIAYTRDIKALGNYTYGYMLVVELFKLGNRYEKEVNKDVIQNNAYLIFEMFVKKYGSWKDVKYFLNYYVEDLHKDKKSDLSNDFFIKKIVKMVCRQMKENSNSLIAKWMPREKSNKFGWLTPLFAREYYSEWFSETMSAGQYKAATRKALTHFRQLISGLNKEKQNGKITYNKYLNESMDQTMDNNMKSWETIVKELTNIRYNDLDNLKY